MKMVKKVLISISTVISLLLLITYFTYDYWLERELKYQLSEIISKDPNSLYKYKFKKLNINLIDGSVQLLGISVEPRQRAYDSLAAPNNGVRFLLEVKLEDIELNGFEIREFIKTNKIIVESIEIGSPVFTYLFDPSKKLKTNTAVLGDLFSDKFVSAELGKFIISNGKVVIDNYNSPDPALTINELSIMLTKARVDSASIKQFTPLNYEEIKVSAAGINLDMIGDFSIVSDSLHFDAKNETLLIQNFQLKPKYTQSGFSNAYNFQKQWFAITLESLVLNRIELDEFVNSGIVQIGRIDINKPNIALFKDKSKPLPPFKKKFLPASMVKNIPLQIAIDSTRIQNGYISLNERSHHTGLDSFLSFYNLYGTVSNFTNSEDRLSKSSNLVISVSTNIYNQAAVSINMLFDLNSEIDAFEAMGSVGPVAMTAFNPVLEPMMAVKIIDGNLENLNFKFSGNDTLSTGILDMNYSNAKIEVFNSDTTHSSKKQNLMTFAANTIIKTNNQSGKSSYIQGVIRAERVQEKDVWPFLWHSVQSGIVSTLAPIMNSKEVKQIQKQTRQDAKNNK